MRNTPTYKLYELQMLLQNEATRIITASSRKTAVSLGYADGDDMVARVLKLKRNEFFKSMPADVNPGLWQDVYITKDGTTEIYIKLQKSKDDKGIIISFKRSERE
jgi:hypothetical protein